MAEQGNIEKVAVIGSGIMGAAIAAQVANSGHEVILLDIVPKEDDKDRSHYAKSAIERMVKEKGNMRSLMHKRFAKRITPGNIEDDLELLKDADWIIEVIIEDLDTKKDLYKTIEPYRKKGAIVSSNTSTIPLESLIEGQSDDFKENFVITHFFNPPRYMRLLELVGGEKSRSEALDAVEAFADVNLGKRVIRANDSPGFIGNRIGVYWMTRAINETIDMGLTVEEADTLLSRPFSIPKTGVFALADMVGLQLFPKLKKSLTNLLPEDDAYCQEVRELEFLNKMIEEGYIGRAAKDGKGGFTNFDRETRTKLVRDFETGEYRPYEKPILEAIEVSKESGLKALLDYSDKYAEFCWKVMGDTLHYAASLVPEIADTIEEVDSAMHEGYNWGKGPFQLINELGTDWIAKKWEAEGKEVPEIIKKANGCPLYKVENGKPQYLDLSGSYKDIKRPEGVLLLSDVKLGSEPVAKNGSASLWNVGDGVLCFEFHTKMNVMDQNVFELYKKTIEIISDDSNDYKALVIHNEGDHFSAGANLVMAQGVLNTANYEVIDQFVQGGQDAYMALKYADFPVVAAPKGLCLGGGCEILLHCDKVMAHADSFIGLVEVGVGLIPAWGGTKEMLLRNHLALKKKLGPTAGGPTPATHNAFQTIGLAARSLSAYEAFDYLYLIPKRDQVVMNSDRLLFNAKKEALELAVDYKAPEPSAEENKIPLPGPGGKGIIDLNVKAMHKKGLATKYDIVVSEALAEIVTGGEKAHTEQVSELDLLKLEKEQFMGLVRNQETLDRIEHMIATGKPLRN